MDLPPYMRKSWEVERRAAQINHRKLDGETFIEFCFRMRTCRLHVSVTWALYWIITDNLADFESIQEEAALSPDSRDVARYEEYCRRELPRLFRANIEEILCREMQQIAEPLLQNLDSIFQNCQDRMYRSYLESTGRGQEADSDSNIATNAPLYRHGEGFQEDENSTGFGLTGSGASNLLEPTLHMVPSIPDSRREMGNEESAPVIAQSINPLANNKSSASYLGYSSEKLCSCTHACDCLNTDTNIYDHALNDGYSVEDMGIDFEVIDWQGFSTDFLWNLTARDERKCLEAHIRHFRFSTSES